MRLCQILQTLYMFAQVEDDVVLKLAGVIPYSAAEVRTATPLLKGLQRS